MVKLRCRLRAILLMAMIMGLPWFQVAWADLNDGLVAYYPFDGNADDESGNGNDGTVHGAALTEDRFGNADSAYLFDGYGNETDSINLPHTVLDGLTDFTTSLWIKAGNPNQKQATLLSAANQTQDNSYLVQIESDSEIEATIKNELFTNFSNKKDYDLHDNKWHHVSITRQNDTGLAHIFVDGELVESGNFPKGALSIGEGGLMLGREQDCLAGCFDPIQDLSGSLDKLMIHNRILSEAEIQELYHENAQTDCDEHAVYSVEKNRGKLTIPFLNVPLLDGMNHQPSGLFALFKGEFTQKNSVLPDFSMLSNRFKPVFLTPTNEACYAVYSFQDKTLDIPFVDVGADVYEITLKHLQEVPLNLGIFRLESYNLLYTK